MVCSINNNNNDEIGYKSCLFHTYRYFDTPIFLLLFKELIHLSLNFKTVKVTQHTA